MRVAVGIVATAIVATLCAGALAAVGGDNAKLPLAAIGFAGPPSHEDLAAVRPNPAWQDRPSDRLSWPLHGAVTGQFGEPRFGHMHEGIDIPEPLGTPIKAAAPGKVVMRELQDGYGNYTCIAHRTVTTCYGHQQRFGVKLGEHVRRGQVIGFVGNTGNSPFVHLHFEVRRGTKPWGKAVDPAKRLPH